MKLLVSTQALLHDEQKQQTIALKIRYDPSVDHDLLVRVPSVLIVRWHRYQERREKATSFWPSLQEANKQLIEVHLSAELSSFRVLERNTDC